MFSQNDLKGDIQMKLTVIIMAMLEKYPLTPVNHLFSKERKQFDELLNDYINQLPENDWEEHITTDFNKVCIDKIFTSSFQPEKFAIQPSMETIL